MDKKLLLLGGIGLGAYLITRPSVPATSTSGASTAGLPTIPQSQTRDERGNPWPIGQLVRVTNPNGIGSYTAVVVAG